jgi:hypothetical protein
MKKKIIISLLQDFKFQTTHARMIELGNVFIQEV